VTTSVPPPATHTTHAATTHHVKHHHKHAKQPPPPATSATSVGTLTNTAQTGPAKTLAAATSSSTGVPRIAVFASIAAGSLVLLAFIALGVSILVSRGRPERKAGGGNILIR
jgi:hypothetical protein